MPYRKQFESSTITNENDTRAVGCIVKSTLSWNEILIYFSLASQDSGGYYFIVLVHSTQVQFKLPVSFPAGFTLSTFQELFRSGTALFYSQGELLLLLN